jgi:HCOMODA/2-hydroxy-3-carboxy-muconic semialdehyde decarboxylase
MPALTEKVMNRRKLLAGGSASLFVAQWPDVASTAEQVAAKLPDSQPLPATDAERVAELVDANHILADLGILEGFGHISVRSATNPTHFLISRSLAPAAVTAADIMELDQDCQAVDARGRELYGERFIHGEIFRARPDVMSVVHSHAREVLPFTVTNVPLKALIHVGFFLGTDPAPVFDLAKAMGADNQMLINGPAPGAALARVLGNRSVVLMRGHGMSVAAPSIRDAVFRAIYTRENARVELDALKLGTPVFMNQFEVKRFDNAGRQWNQWVADAAAKRGGR